MNKAMLFDLDGVLVDTAKYHFIAWKKLADELGIPFTAEDNERFKGVSRARCMEILLELGGRAMDEEEQRFYCDKKNRIFNAWGKMKCSPELQTSFWTRRQMDMPSPWAQPAKIPV